MSNSEMARAFKRAVELVGGATAAAEICASSGKSCSRQNIHQLLSGNRPCPPGFVRVMSDASGVRRSALRPDLYPVADEPTEPPPGWGLREKDTRPEAAELEAAGQARLPLDLERVANG